ncbi:Uncharacterised protein [Pseudomonas luteola]|uniref:Uncharacterized protein n=1 Tax=Pseudomonas luteola TaxID=47886 RepID=A0A2X2CCK1_PSELU|nr:hypothetical protein [Pseudomonas luteola]SPZ04853.1 Uncharacterised protein [Pseudomonas luteola]
MSQSTLLILTYELKDDPGIEHEVEVADLGTAVARLGGCTDMIVWADLIDSNGILIAETSDLI